MPADRSRHEALVRAFVARYGDPAMVDEVFSDRAVWLEPGASPISGRFVGRSAIRGLIDDVVTRSGGTFKILGLSELLVGEQHGLAVLDVEAQHDGRYIRTTDRLLVTFDAGLISSVVVVSADQAEVDQFWE